MDRSIILASTSPRRFEILSESGIPFTVYAPDYEEDMTLYTDPALLAKELSLGKALAVAEKYPEAIVIGADTFISYQGVLLGKPHTGERAREMLQKLSGTTHSVVTGLSVVLLSENKKLQDIAEAQVTFRCISEDEIEAYIATGEPLDRAGAYAIQGGAKKFVESIEGDYHGILGLPLKRLLAILEKEFGVVGKSSIELL
jgi:septum formation protein